MAEPAAPPTAPAGTGVATETENDRILAAVAYILLWVTGLVVFLLSKPQEKYKRWHAVQAIALGIVVTALHLLFSLWSGVMGALWPRDPAGAYAGGAWAVPVLIFGFLVTILYLLVLVLIIVLAVRAYQGQRIRLPGLAGFADRHA